MAKKGKIDAKMNKGSPKKEESLTLDDIDTRSDDTFTDKGEKVLKQFKTVED